MKISHNLHHGFTLLDHLRIDETHELKPLAESFQK